MQLTVILSSLCKWKRQKMVVFVVKRYAVREAEKWRYAVRKAKIGRYAVRQGGGGCYPHESPKRYRILPLKKNGFVFYIFVFATKKV